MNRVLYIGLNTIATAAAIAMGYYGGYVYNWYQDYRVLDACAAEAGVYRCEFIPQPVNSPILPPPVESGE